MSTPFQPETSPQPARTPLVIWVVRIGVTLFLVPFFVVGFGLLFGGSMFPGGTTHEGMGLFRLFGLPFVAVPTIMLVVVWTARAKGERPGAQRQAAGTDPTSSPPRAPTKACAYCGSPRPSEDARCTSCGGA